MSTVIFEENMTIEDVEKRIAYWSKELDLSRNDLVRADYADKIRQGYLKIAELKDGTRNNKPVIKDKIDAAPLVDRLEAEKVYGANTNSITDFSGHTSVKIF